MKMGLQDKGPSRLLALQQRGAGAELYQKCCVMEVLQENPLEMNFEGLSEGMGLDQPPR